MLDPDPGGQKGPTKKRKVRKFHVLKCWTFCLEAGGFSCSFDFLHGDLGINILQFLEKIMIFYNFLSSHLWIRFANWIQIDLNDLKCWIRISK
jgi:hypothetical protein